MLHQKTIRNKQVQQKSSEAGTLKNANSDLDSEIFSHQAKKISESGKQEANFEEQSDKVNAIKASRSSFLSLPSLFSNASTTNSYTPSNNKVLKDNTTSQAVIDEEKVPQRQSSLRSLQKRVWSCLLMNVDNKMVKKLCDKIVNRHGWEVLSQGHVNSKGWNILHAACYFGRAEVVQMLIREYKVELHLTNTNGWDALMFTIMGSSLRSRSAKSSDKGCLDNHSTDLASHVEIANQLLSQGSVDQNSTDSSGHTAQYYLQSVDPLGTGPLTQLFNSYNHRQSSTRDGCFLDACTRVPIEPTSPYLKINFEDRDGEERGGDQARSPTEQLSQSEQLLKLLDSQ